jgi:hypothetical protein
MLDWYKEINGNEYESYKENQCLFLWIWDNEYDEMICEDY